MFYTKKSLGQNFLINPHILDRIVSAAEVTKDDTILEVGPGTGNLTKKLAEKAKQVITVEKDRRLIGPLQETLKGYGNLEIIEGDILNLDVTCYMLHEFGFKIVASIPYYITSRFLRMLLEEWPKPKLIILTIQKEVAQRILAKPPHMNLLALSIQYYSEPKIICSVSKNNFRPIPKVDSAIIRLVPRIFEVEPQIFSEVRPQKKNKEQTEKLFELIRFGFSEKRKQLAGVLSKKLKLKKEYIIEALEKTHLDSEVRPEKLTLKQWIELEKNLNI